MLPRWPIAHGTATISGVSPTEQAVTIRTATSADRSALLALDALLTTRDGTLLSPIAGLSTEEIELLAAKGSSIGSHLLVAERDGTIVGYAFTSAREVNGLIDAASTALILQRLVVLPASRRCGVGAALLKEVEHKLSSNPRSVLQAHVPDSAVPFYESQGWHIAPPGHALAWIEVPSIGLWEAARRDGVDAGPRRKIAMLRTEDSSADSSTGYGRLAFKVLRPELLAEHFTFAKSSDLTLRDAMILIADQIVENPARRRLLPPDVSKIIFDMVLIPRLGLESANALRRG